MTRLAKRGKPEMVEEPQAENAVRKTSVVLRVQLYINVERGKSVASNPSDTGQVIVVT